MEQWKDEVKKKTTKGFLKVTTHHGPGRFDGEFEKLPFFLVVVLINFDDLPPDAHDLEKYDVIVSSSFLFLLPFSPRSPSHLFFA